MKIYKRDQNMFIVGDRVERIDNEDKHPYYMVPLFQYKYKQGYISDEMLKRLEVDGRVKSLTHSPGDELFACISITGGDIIYSKEKLAELLD